MIYDPDDMIGMGDAAAVVARLRKNVGKFRKFVRKVGGKTSAASAAVSRAASPAPAVVEVAPAAGGGMADFFRKNMIAVAGVGLLGVLLLARKKRT